GSTLALLPAQNATGNFVKVVQRLPVRIDLEEYDPDKDPLFTGTSVVPYVYINKSPAGPDAGKFLQTSAPQSQTTEVPQNPPGITKWRSRPFHPPGLGLRRTPGWWPLSSLYRRLWRCSTPLSR